MKRFKYISSSSCWVVSKTAVLVERIIERVINDNVDIDKLLVVTFTNAAKLLK